MSLQSHKMLRVLSGCFLWWPPISPEGSVQTDFRVTTVNVSAPKPPIAFPWIILPMTSSYSYAGFSAVVKEGGGRCIHQFPAELVEAFPACQGSYWWPGAEGRARKDVQAWGGNPKEWRLSAGTAECEWKFFGMHFRGSLSFNSRSTFERFMVIEKRRI